MRMDNETFRLKVENLLNTVRSSENGALSEDVMSELEQLAKTPRKSRYFLGAVSGQVDEELQEHFYRIVMSGVRSEHDVNDLERHIRHMFYEDREHAKAMLARLARRDVLPAIFRVISFTEEGWLAGELIRIVLAAPPEELHDPLVAALESKEYLLQCLAIYLIGKSGEDDLLGVLAKFYRRPVGEKVDRLERKALDSLLEGAKQGSDALVLKWLGDKSSRVREVALGIAAERRLIEGVGEVAGLVLIDPKTRSKAAETILSFETSRALTLNPDDPSARGIATLIQRAKQQALQTTLRSLMRDESPAVREVAAKFSLFLNEPGAVSAQVRRLAVEDRSVAVQVAALRVLAAIDHEKLVPVLVEVFTDSAALTAGGKEVVDVASELMTEILAPNQVRDVQEGIRAKEERRDAALDRFGGNVEWWRHDI